MHCPSCNAECKIGTKFCPECGAALSQRCPSCSAECKPGAKFCGECGTPLAKASANASAKSDGANASRNDSLRASSSAPGAPQQVAGERRQLTVMFCDVVNSTGLSESLDPEELRDYMRLFHETAAKVIHRFDGLIAKYLGDGLLVHFGYPNAHEDDAQRAVRSGLGILDALKFLHFKTSSGKILPIDIRIGIHTGLVVIDEIGAESQRKMDIVGDTPNIAARLQSLAEPNTLIVSANTFHLIAGFFEEDYLGPQTIRGLSMPLDVYRILHESSARSRLQVRTAISGLTPMVGRDAEIARMRAIWSGVVEGQGQTVLLCGEAGIGKSRITDALKMHVAKERDAWLTETECSPYHQNTAFHPVAQLMERTVLQFTPEDDVAARYAKLEGFLAQYGYDVNESVPLLAPILSLPPDARYKPLDPLALSTRQKTMELLLNLLLRRASLQPVLYIVEDVHWADPSSLELIGMIIAQTPGTRMLTYLTFRPEFKPTWPGVELMTLNRLAQGHTREMVDHLVQNKKIPEALAIQILNKTDGVPLFVEELTKTVLETGRLVDRGDRYELDGKIEELAIPSTLKDSLMARLDRLSTSKLVAQVAATIGREFSFPLLRAVTELNEATLSHELDQLSGSGLIFQRGLPPTATYIFKHALVQDAAYDSQLKSRRQEVHRKINEALLRDFPDIAQSQPETLAIHYMEAGMIPEAVGEWLRAGQQAGSRSASLEAIADYERGLELLSTLDADSPVHAYELPLQLSLGITLLMAKGYSNPEVAEPLARARELCAAVPDAPQLPLILWSLWAYYLVRAEHAESRPLSDELWRIANERKENGQIIEASFTRTVEFFVTRGGFRDASEEVQRVRTLYRIENHACTVTGYIQDALGCSLSWGIWSEWILGRPDNSRAWVQELIRHQDLLGHIYSTAYAGVCLGSLGVLMEDESLAEEWGNHSMKVTSERGYPFLMAISMAILAWLKSRKGGSLEESMAMFDQAIGIWKAIGSTFWRTMPYTWKIDTHLMHRDYAGARAALDIAYDEVKLTGEPFMMPVLKRQEADIILGEAQASSMQARSAQAGPSPNAVAEGLYREAIDMARSFEAKSFELAALLHLHPLLGDSPKGAQTIEEIRTVYESFDGGHDLPLLTRAKRTLESSKTSVGI